MGKKKSIGLPGGPNEFLQDITQYISVEGYKSYSPDKNNPVNIIESGSITMEDVEFPVLGTDNLGNTQMMQPGMNYQFPGDQVFEIPMAQYGIENKYPLPKRNGVRLNYDEEGNVNGESSHIMRTETLDGKNWFSFPTLFQDEDDAWIDMSKEKNWMPAYEEAKRRGEVIDFGTDKESAIKFGEGSWKLKTLPKAQFGLFNKMGIFNKIKKNLADGFNAGVGYTGIARDGINYDDSTLGILRRLYNVGIKGEAEPFVSEEIDWDSKEGNSDDTYIDDKLAEASQNLEQNLFRLYLDQDQVGKYQLSESQYRPSKGDNKVDKYLSIPKEYQDNVYGQNEFPTIIDIQEYEGLPNKDIVDALSSKYNKVIDRDMVVGDYTRGIGLNEDDNIYLSAYDKFDLNPFPSQVGDMSMGIGKPQDIYDRFNYVRVNANKYPEFTFLTDPGGSSSYSDALVREDNLEDYLELKRGEQKRYEKFLEEESTQGDFFRQKGGQLAEAQQGYEFRQGDENLFQREIFDYKNFADKLASPFTAFGYSARNEPIPKGLNVSNPERNNLDMLVDVFNPFAWVQYAENANQNFKEGEILDGTLNALGAIPIVPAWMSRGQIKEIPKMINKLINPKGSTAIKDQVKKWSGNTPRNLDDITLVKGERPPHVMEQPKTGGPVDGVMPDGANLQTPLQQLAAGADSFKATIQKRLNDLKPGSEGFERLVEAEAKYLQSVGQPYSRVFAERNALARYTELVKAKGNTINDNALAMWKDAIGDPNHVNHRIARELFKNQEGLYYNAWFRNAPRSEVLEAGDFVPTRYSDPITGLEMPMPKDFNMSPNLGVDLKRLGKESIPGKLTTGMKYSNNAPVEVHEINHLLQASRKMPLDDYARKLTPSTNLSKSGKAQWDYFKSGSRGQEPTSYLAELRQAMLDRGIIKNVYDKITPNKLIQAEVSFANKPRGFYDYGWVRGGKNTGFLSNTRVLDLYEKTARNREILSNALNKLPAAIPVVGASTALSQEQDGGSITPELLMKQAYVESNWDPNIVNSKGYTGLGQIGSQLAEDYKKANKIKGDINLLDPKVNAAIQKWSMNELINSSFINKGNSTDEVKLAKALAAYNWGRGRMSNMLVKQKDAGVDIYKSLDWLSELPKETLEYYKMITTDDFNPETRPLMQQDYLKALENDSIIQNYYKKSGGEYSVFKDYVNGKYNNTKHENHAEKIYDKLNRIHYREAKEAGMSPANFIMTNIMRYS